MILVVDSRVAVSPIVFWDVPSIIDRYNKEQAHSCM